jgi:zinc protease
VPGALEKGIAILADFAGHVSCSPAELEKERDVILEEARLRSGARTRVRAAQDPVLFRGSPHADREPIGVEAVIRHVPADDVRAFYQAWYRPELMAVVVAGTVDPTGVAATLREAFASVRRSAAPATSPLFPVPEHDDTRHSVADDEELDGTAVAVHYKRHLDPHDPPTCIVDHTRSSRLEELAGTMLNRRLDDVAESAKPPFDSASVRFGALAHGTDELLLWANAKEGEAPRALGALLTELERARRHGFLPDELARAKAQVLADAETRWLGRDHVESAAQADRLVNAFLRSWIPTSAEYEHETYLDLVPAMSASEVAEALRRRSEPKNRVILVSLPRRAGAVPTVEDLRRAMPAEGSTDIAPWVDALAGHSLALAPARTGRVIGRRSIPEVGVTELTLSNGLRVVVKPTDFAADEVLIRGFAIGGACDLPESDIPAAYQAGALAKASGTASLTAADLRKLLAGHVAECRAEIREFTRELEGRCRPGDLGILLQLVHSIFVEPGFREDAHANLVDEWVTAQRLELNDPFGVLNVAINELAFGSHPAVRRLREDELRSPRRADCERVFRSAFGDASEWTILLVGNFDVARDSALLGAWLASLPSTRRDQRRKPADLPRLLECATPGTTRLVVKGRDPLSMTTLLFPVSIGADLDQSYHLEMAGKLLGDRLHERIRERAGQTYTILWAHVDALPNRHGGAAVLGVPCAPEARSATARAMREEIARLRRDLPSEAEVATLHALARNALDEAERANGAWVERLYTRYACGLAPVSILEIPARIDGLDAASIRAVARRWLNPAKASEVILYPESWEPARWIVPRE